MMIHIRLILLLCFLLHYFRGILCNNNTDKDILLSFKFQVTDPNNALSGWLTDSNHCNWYGVTCSNLGNRVQSLNLSRLGLSGKLPSQLSNLTYLHSLDLSKNKFHGQIPFEFGHLSLLNLIKLAFNNLSGTLALATNRFEGVIPSSISNASNLQKIDLTNNNFHGSIPLFNNLKNLTHLILGNNYLSSTNSLNYKFFDSLRNSTQLQILMINDNNLTGELPSSVANLSTNLQQFCVADNWLTGNIPQGMKKFQDLISFSFESNYFTGELPLELGALNKLEQLWIYKIDCLGKFPIFLRLSLLHLGMNRFSGTIPEEIFQLSSLTTLYLTGNSLHGSLPPGVNNMEQLETMDISDNQLSGGSIPNSLGDIASLETLDLSSNNLTGPIPQSLEKLQYMVMLNLSFNHLEGVVPMKGVFMNLSRVDLRGNSKLCGLNNEIVQKLGVSLCVVAKKKRNILLPIILAIITGAIALFISILYRMWVLMSRKKEYKHRKTSLSSAPLMGLPQNITYADIRFATNNFSAENLIGKGGFGSVYKGLFSMSTVETTTLAIKVLDKQQSKASQSFNIECEALRNVRHRNLVKVITSCSSVDYKGDDFKALVMQFMANGNLDMSLYPNDEESGSSLTLLQRLNIAIDVASAMDYLHHDCDPPIVHCDLKPVNVLLDDDMVAHVADFGLARFLSQNPSEQQSSTMGLKGSIGYIAPESLICPSFLFFSLLIPSSLLNASPSSQVPKAGLSDTESKRLLHQGRVVRQVFKAVKSINENVLLEMPVPAIIKDALVKFGKANLGQELHKVLTTESSSGEHMLKSLNLNSKHIVLETINRLEAAIFSWRERITEQISGKSPVRTSWSFVKDPMSEVDKMELLLDRAETLLQLLKIRYPNLPKTFLDVAKVQYGKDIGHSILETYSRVLANLAFSILSRIGDILQEDCLSNPNSPVATSCSPGINLSETWVVGSHIKHSLLDKMNKVDVQFCDSSCDSTSDLELSSIDAKSSAVIVTPNQSRVWCIGRKACTSVSPQNSP
ncbi:Serine-threonine/tyrosine-protein kinase, catalytic domain [Sesbania bispinosa]|nr:Serine-threonine/tyrosine-protein kinase, catalytic domain [Sesbania bispinosa]